jgi:hypothetical protein
VEQELLALVILAKRILAVVVVLVPLEPMVAQVAAETAETVYHQQFLVQMSLERAEAVEEHSILVLL